MQIYLAPMEGITTYVYRKAYANHFGNIDRYFTPFIANKKMGKRDRDGILPENNPRMELIPQILTNSADDFLSVTKDLAAYGYHTVNLNLGCPSGTVVGKKRGSGFLGQPLELERFLVEIYEKCPLKISIKTRVGLEREEEWEGLLSIYEKFPLEELIIHPRLRKDFYQGEIRYQTFHKAINRMKVPLCYNGEINSVEDFRDICNRFPTIDRVMIGRGILRNPELVEEIRLWEKEKDSKGNEAVAKDNLVKKEYDENSLKRLYSFHQEIYEGYQQIMSGDINTLYKMKELWCYLGDGWEGKEKSLKRIKKAKNLKEYEREIADIFGDVTVKN